MNIIRAEERGKSDLGWLRSRFSFSFADYYDPARMGFGALRVLNDDWVAPGKGFGAHPHSNMEIITIPLSGSLKHKDSSGGEGIVRTNEVQVMTAGRGIVHSEMNASDQPVSFLQIWIEPRKKDLEPVYRQKKYSLAANTWTVLADSKGEEGLKIEQDARILLAEIEKGKSLSLNTQQGVFVFVIEGDVKLNGEVLHQRDAAELAQSMTVTAQKSAKVLVIEVPVDAF